MKNSVKFLSFIALFSLGFLFVSNTSEKVTKLTSSQLNHYFEKTLNNAIEIGHVQATADLVEIQTRFNIDEELSYVRNYEENGVITSVLVTKSNTAYIFSETVKTNAAASPRCGCWDTGTYHVTGDEEFCNRPCNKPGPPKQEPIKK